MKKTVLFIAGICLAGLAAAKLPPLSEEAQAKAVEAKAKAAWSDKVASYKACLAQERTAAAYFKGKGKAASGNLPVCQDPGPFVVANASAPPTAPAAGQNMPSQAVKK